eukprot:6201941-Pleurochrysis_carterae.AAC.2
MSGNPEDYAKIMLQLNKLSPQSTPCIYPGRARNQPGYMCYYPLSKRVYVSPHASLVETEFPCGLAHATRPNPTPRPTQACVPSPTTPPVNTDRDDATGDADATSPGKEGNEAELRENDNATVDELITAD